MNNRLLNFAALGVAAFALLAVTWLPVSAQLANQGDAKAAPKGKGKGKAKGDPIKHITTIEVNQPDFGGPGVWNVPYITNMGTKTNIINGGKEVCEEFANGAGGTTPTCAPFNERGKMVFAARRQTDSATDPEGLCLPPGVPRMMYTPYPMKFVQEPNMITMIFEGGAHVWRQIPLGPKGSLKHDPDFNPGYLGDSFGWWEGDTLVIDTVGFNERTWLDFAGHPHGEKLHVIERFTRLDSLSMDHSATIEDPDFYTQPWTVTINVPYNATNHLIEYICQENESDSKHLWDNLRKKGIDPEKIP
ncbi:MAG: hypothetical protein WDO18_04265 [Acidobacteriota bacterium]